MATSMRRVVIDSDAVYALAQQLAAGEPLAYPRHFEQMPGWQRVGDTS
jgi:hypothetical protein